MELVPPVVWFNTWIFDSHDCAQACYQHKREEESSGRYIPVTLEHIGQEFRKGVLLFLADPNMPVGRMLEELSSKLFYYYRPDPKYSEVKQTFSYFYKSSKQVAQLGDKYTVQMRYDQYKDQRGLLSLIYDFKEEKIFPPSTVKQDLILAALLPVIGTYLVYDWTTKTLKSISSHLPTPPILWPKMHEFKFKAKFSLEQRRQKFEAFNEKQAGMIVIILERHMYSRLPQLPFYRFAVPSNITYRQLCLLLNKRIRPEIERLNSTAQSIFFVIGKNIPSQETLLDDVYSHYKDEDGILYVTYQEQQSFG